MRLVKILPLLTACVASSIAIAQQRNCSELTNPQARQECLKNKPSGNVDCSTLSDSQARKECAERKQQNGVDCSKLATADARQQCLKQKPK